MSNTVVAIAIEWLYNRRRGVAIGDTTNTTTI